MNVISLDLSVAVIMLLVWCLYFVLKKSFFDPINQILAERDASIHGAQREAKEKVQQFDRRTQLYRDSLKTARLESYRQQESFRAEALKQRSKVLAEGRRQAEASVQSAKDDIDAAVGTAKKALGSHVRPIAESIARSILK